MTDGPGKAKLSASLPEGDANGLDDLGVALIKHPHDRHALIIIVETAKTTTDHEKDQVIPTAGIRHIEPVNPDDYAAIEKALINGFQARTGEATLPLDLKANIDGAFRLSKRPRGGSRG